MTTCSWRWPTPSTCQPEATGRSPSAAHFAALTAQEMGLPPERVELLRRAGLVHDIGKLTVPEMLLFKPNGLTAEERRLVQDHAAAGADLLGEYDALQEIAPFVRHHHERYDGQGYPDGLAGEAIPLEARILALSDAAAALAASRSFRRTGLGEGLGAVVAALEAQAGTRFDPAAVAAFARAIQRQEWQRQESPAFAGATQAERASAETAPQARPAVDGVPVPRPRRAQKRLAWPRLNWPQVDWPRTAAWATAPVVVLAGVLLLAAAANSLPGDPLYPVKRGGEGAKAALAYIIGAAPDWHISQVERRLAEMQALEEAGRAPDPSLAAAVKEAEQALARRVLAAAKLRRWQRGRTS